MISHRPRRRRRKSQSSLRSKCAAPASASLSAKFEKLTKLKGLYKETLGEFAAGHDIIIDIDATGRFFFQSWQTGCTGNGTLVPRGAPNVNLYSVQAPSIDACTGAFAT